MMPPFSSSAAAATQSIATSFTATGFIRRNQLSYSIHAESATIVSAFTNAARTPAR